MKRFAIAILAVAMATILTGVVRAIADETMYVFFVGAVALASWSGGLRSGLAAVAISIVAVDLRFVEPIGSGQLFTAASMVRLLSFALVAGMIATLTDALARAKAHAERLARMAEQRKAEAEAASASKSDFLATLSHEVRTPIHAVLGYVDLLEEGTAGPLSEAQAIFVARLRASARHLLMVVHEVLDIAKADAGHLTVEMAPGAASPVIDAAVSVVLPQAMSRHIGVIVLPRRDPVQFRGDANRVREIVVNLLSNAVKFSPDGGHIEIDAGLGADGQGPTAVDPRVPLVWIRVTDHGPGISPTDQGRIFEPFVQGGDPRTDRMQGTGLGLAISWRLSRLMGGDLVVESEPGRGAAFTVWLRAA